MSFLLNSINKTNEAFGKIGSFDSDIGMFTGFTAIDVLSSNIENIGELDVEILNGGLFDYPYTELGMSSVGKSTFIIQKVAAAVDNWYRFYGPVSEAIFYNVEMHTSSRRWQMVTGWDDKMMAERVRFISKPMSIIEIYNDLAVLAKHKLKYRNELEVDTGIRGIGGHTIKVLPTTYVIIDSIAAIRTKTELEFNKDGEVKSTDSVAGTNNMDAMQIAKDNTIFINEAKKLCSDANICILMINHLVEVPVLDRYNPPKPQLPGMKYNQKVKGGNELLYQSFVVYMLTLKERLFNERNKIYGDSVHGIVAFMEWLKNKNGPEGIRYPMVFDTATGYKPELSDFEMLYGEQQYGLAGSPQAYYLKILPEITFSRKTLLDKCHEEPILARAMSFTARAFLVEKHINFNNEKFDFDQLMELPYEARIYLILKHSIDYPTYINHGWVVPDEYFEIYRDFAMVLEQEYYMSERLKQEAIELMTMGFLDSEKVFSLSGETFKIGNTEYVLPDGEEYW
jgi:hypothetical protein